MLVYDLSWKVWDHGFTVQLQILVAQYLREFRDLTFHHENFPREKLKNCELVGVAICCAARTASEPLSGHAVRSGGFGGIKEGFWQEAIHFHGYVHAGQQQ